MTEANRIKRISYEQLQSGSVLLVFLLLIIIGSGYMLLTRLNVTARHSVYNQRTAVALAQAKQALIAYAVTYYESNPGKYGFLPCPDSLPTLGTEGNQDPGCGSRNVNSLGRLPWKSLGLPPPRDGDGECLWYAVSGEYKVNKATRMLNEDSNGTFRIYKPDGTGLLAGTAPADRPVAVIIAPGRALTVQNQDHTLEAGAVICGGNYTASNYLDAEVPAPLPSGILNYALETGNKDRVDTFISSSNATRETFNDVIAFITRREIFDAIRKRNDYAQKLYDSAAVNNLTRNAADCVRKWGLSHGGGNYSLPWPAPVDLDDYRKNGDYDDVNGSANLLSGRLPNKIKSSRDAVGGGSDKLIENCSNFTSSAELMALWKNWKDHLFYAVADAYQPAAGATPACGNGLRCITVNNNYPANANRDYAAVVIFSNTPLPALNQIRDAPPIDADNKADINNYLEGSNNPVLYTDSAGDDTKRYDQLNTTSTFNDVLYCINDDDGGSDTLAVTPCPSI
ncbi:MAG: hypothetical protein ACE5GZ_06140 [Gammaproteobacteria bacterium]